MIVDMGSWSESGFNLSLYNYICHPALSDMTTITYNTYTCQIYFQPLSVYVHVVQDERPVIIC